MSCNFEERSGLVTTKTEWGSWGQTIEEVLIELNVGIETSSKGIKCDIKTKYLSMYLHGECLIKGELYGPVIADECVWTLEDKKTIRIILCKAVKDPAKAWKALLASGEYPVDAWTYNEMEKKLTLEKFQRENPGFDFSKADISGNYHGGGPSLP